MNPITLYFAVFFPTLITLFIVVIFVRAYMIYKHALVIIKRIEPDNKSRFQTAFKNVTFVYQYTKGAKVSSSPLLKADLYWPGSAFVLIQEKKFLPLGSLLPIVFAASSDPFKTKSNFPDLDVYGMASVKVNGGESVFILKSATQSDVSIVLTILDLTEEQLNFLRKVKK